MFNPQQKSNASKKVIFNASSAVLHLRAVRAAANEEPLWWSGVFHQDWASTRKGSNGTQWVNFSYTDASGVSGRTIMRVKGERHTGRIMPATDAGIAEVADCVALDILASEVVIVDRNPDADPGAPRPARAAAPSADARPEQGTASAPSDLDDLPF